MYPAVSTINIESILSGRTHYVLIIVELSHRIHVLDTTKGNLIQNCREFLHVFVRKVLFHTLQKLQRLYRCHFILICKALKLKFLAQIILGMILAYHAIKRFMGARTIDLLLMVPFGVLFALEGVCDFLQGTLFWHFLQNIVDQITRVSERRIIFFERRRFLRRKCLDHIILLLSRIIFLFFFLNFVGALPLHLLLFFHDLIKICARAPVYRFIVACCEFWFHQFFYSCGA